MKLQLSKESFGATAAGKRSSKDLMVGLAGTSQASFGFASRNNQQPGHHSSLSQTQQKPNLLLADPSKSSQLFKKAVVGKSSDHPSIVSRQEYLMNKASKPTHIMNLKPEKAGMIDRRLQERDFSTENELNRSHKVARDAKAMRLNRR